jgi:hypothetical protein
MLTLFAVPKPFRGVAASLQHNALASWRHLGDHVRLLLCGDDEGVAEAAAMYGATHVPDVAVNEYGTPLVDSVFAKAQALAETPLLGYVNADIVFLDDLLPSLRRVALRHFLLVGRRFGLELNERLDVHRPGWEQELRARAHRSGRLDGPIYVDYFVFRRESPVGELLPFAVGRPGWDNWLIFQTRRRRIPVVDATRSVTAIHQDHGYEHVPDGEGYRWVGPEARANWALAQGAPLYSILHATHVLTARGVRPAFEAEYVRSRWRGRHDVDGGLERMARVIEPLVVATRPLRRVLGRSNLWRGLVPTRGR